MNALLGADHALRAWVVTHRIGAMNPLMLAISGAAYRGIAWLLISAAIAAIRRRADVFVAVATAVVIAGVVNDGWLKRVLYRERPFLSTPAIAVLGPRSSGSSFPSGHTALSFAAAGVLSSLVPSARAGWWAGAIAVACSRVYLGVHYPLDVIAGAAVGIASAAIALVIVRFGFRRITDARRDDQPPA